MIDTVTRFEDEISSSVHCYRTKGEREEAKPSWNMNVFYCLFFFILLFYHIAILNAVTQFTTTEAQPGTTDTVTHQQAQRKYTYWPPLSNHHS